VLDNNIFLRRISKYTKTPLFRLKEIIYGESDLPRLYETGLIDSGRFFERIVELCDLNIKEGEFITAYTDIFTPIPGTFELVKKLKPSYTLAILSNTSEWDFVYGIRPIGIFDLFDTITLSFEVKAMKPDPKIFFDALKKLRFEPQECVYIDDMIEYAAIARELGFHGFLYTTHKNLLNDLQSLDIKLS
jgi:FMN phosphatase YigB (HAD superfamily)